MRHQIAFHQDNPDKPAKYGLLFKSLQVRHFFTAQLFLLENLKVILMNFTIKELLVTEKHWYMVHKNIFTRKEYFTGSPLQWNSFSKMVAIEKNYYGRNTYE